MMEVEREIIEKSYAKLKEATGYLCDDIENDYDCALDELYNAAIANQVIAKSARSEDVAEAISRIQGGYGDVWQWPKKRRDTIITALQAYQPWIPVSERLPESGKHVLLCCEFRPSGKRYVCSGNWDDYSSIFFDYFITHWKPLPEPPKGE